MARLFSIFFDYEGLPYSAMVSVRTNPFFTEYELNQLDEKILSMLPGNKIIENSPGSFSFLNHHGKQSTLLMHVIINAVASHLQASEV
jgi:hypothetical protein